MKYQSRVEIKKRQILKEQSQNRYINMKAEILKEMESEGIPIDGVTTNRRSRKVHFVGQRQEFARRARSRNLPLTDIAFMMNYEDHTSIMNLLAPEKRQSYREHKRVEEERKADRREYDKQRRLKLQKMQL